MVNEHVMFNKPSNSATTSAFVNTSAVNASYMTNSQPAGNPGGGSKVMRVDWTFKTGVANAWVRLNTFNPTFIRNPAFELQQKIQFDVYCTRALRVAVGMRETGTTAAIGADGGTTGSIEWVGVTNATSGMPNPTRTISASTWTTLTFDCPNEPITSFTGNGVLASGKGALEHIALVPSGSGAGLAYTFYIDNFKQIYSYNPSNQIPMNSSATLSFTATSTDTDVPAQTVTYSLSGAPAGASINSSSGAFTWTPSSGNTTNTFSIVGTDNGTPAKTGSKSITVAVATDPLGVQSDTGLSFARANETVIIEWESIAGHSYRVDYKTSSNDSWQTLTSVVAAGDTTSVEASGAEERYYRIVDTSGSPGVAE
jgi:hypothetical protein